MCPRSAHSCPGARQPPVPYPPQRRQGRVLEGCRAQSSNARLPRAEPAQDPHQWGAVQGSQQPPPPAALGWPARTGREVLGEPPPDESEEATASSCGEECSPKYNYFCSYNKEKSYGGGKTGINSKPDYVAVPGAPAQHERQSWAKQPLSSLSGETLLYQDNMSPRFSPWHPHGLHAASHQPGQLWAAGTRSAGWSTLASPLANAPLQAKPQAAACSCWFLHGPYECGLCVLSRQLCAH